MGLHMKGRARLLGDDVNTDYIISSSRKKETLDPQRLKDFLLETLDPRFAASVLPDDVIVAGRNFGCGSAMEVAVTTVLGAGIRCVVAASFARTYYRNAINNGLLPVICATPPVKEGDLVEIEIGTERILLRNPLTGAAVEAPPLSDVALTIVSAGGLVPYLKRHGGFAFAAAAEPSDTGILSRDARP